MSTALQRLSGSAFELTLTVPWADVKKTFDQVFDEIVAQTEIEGFRKGKAPKELVEKQIDKTKLYSEVVNRILPEAYQKALEEHGLKPVMSPQVHIVTAEEEKDWQFLAKSAEKPQIDLKDYRQKISELNAKGKIWTPGQDVPTTDKTQSPQEKNEEKNKKVSEIINILLQTASVELPELLVESEVNRLMTQLIEDVRQAGLTFEQYLQSSSQTAESLKDKYHHQAEEGLKLEFVLEAVAEDLKITVTPDEIQAIIAKESDPNRKKSLQEQSYMLASLIRRENTVNKLLTL